MMIFHVCNVFGSSLTVSVSTFHKIILAPETVLLKHGQI